MQGDDPAYTETSAGEYTRSYDTEEDVLGHQRSGFLWTAIQAAGKTAQELRRVRVPRGQAGRRDLAAVLLRGHEYDGAAATRPSSFTPALQMHASSAIPSLNAITDPNAAPFDTSVPDIYRYADLEAGLREERPVELPDDCGSRATTPAAPPTPGRRSPTTTSLSARSLTRSRTPSTGRTPRSSSPRTTARTAPTTSTATAPRSRSSALTRRTERPSARSTRRSTWSGPSSKSSAPSP